MLMGVLFLGSDILVRVHVADSFLSEYYIVGRFLAMLLLISHHAVLRPRYPVGSLWVKL